jgi:predicted Zn-dependent peptidase
MQEKMRYPAKETAARHERIVKQASRLFRERGFENVTVVARITKDGVTADELEKAKKTWLDQRALERADEGDLAGTLADLERWGRTMAWEESLETKVSQLTPQRVNDALKRYLDPATIAIVKAGDFKKAGAYQQ